MAFPWWALFAGLVILGAAGAALVIRRRTGAPQTGVSGVAVARITRGIAILWAAASLIGTLNDALRKLYATTVGVNLPVEQFWPSLPTAAQVNGASADVVSGGFTQAMVQVTGLDVSARVWLASSDVLQGATNIIIGVVLAILCTSIIKQNPFRITLIRGINLMAITVIVGGLGWQICDAVAGSLASTQVLGINGWALNREQLRWDDVNEVIGLPRAGNDWSVDFWPIWVGLALLALAAAFRYGQRLQKDTDGLI